MADEQDSHPTKQLSPSARQALRERTRQWLLGIGTVLALTGTIMGFLTDSLGLVEYFQQIGATPTPTQVVPLPQQLALLLTPSPTPWPTSTYTPEPTATATPLPVLAAQDERLLLVAQFANFGGGAGFNVAGRISEALAAQVLAARLEDTRVAVWPDAIGEAGEAAEVVQQSGAALLIWGEYDSGRVRVRFILPDGGADVDWQRLLSGPDELSTTINLDVPREAQAVALMALGRLYRDAGDTTRARAAFAQALDQKPSDATTMATLTFYLAFLDGSSVPPRLDEAIGGYSQVVETQPAWINARYNRGIAYLQRYWVSADSADLEAALADFTWTVGARPSYVEALINRGIVYFARAGEDDFQLAVADFSDALGLDPGSYRAHYNRGLAYIRMGEARAWKHDLSEALALAPTFWPSDHALCWGYALENDPLPGLPHCETAVENGNSDSVRDARGLVLAELGRLEEAADDLERYVAWLDTQPEVWAELNSRSLYVQLIEVLRAGENPVTPQILAQLR